MIKRIFSKNFNTSVFVVPFIGGNAETTVVDVPGNKGYKVNIDDFFVYIIETNHANVIITPYYARWNPSYVIEILSTY